MTANAEGRLNFRFDRTNSYKAWAPNLYPADSLIPFYRITKIAKNQAVRRVSLRRIGHPDLEIDLAANLAEAKQKAQDDYEKRQVSEHLKKEV